MKKNILCAAVITAGCLLSFSNLSADRGGGGGGGFRGGDGGFGGGNRGGDYGYDRAAYDAGYNRGENNGAAWGEASIDDIDDGGYVWPPQDQPGEQSQQSQLGVPNPYAE